MQAYLLKNNSNAVSSAEMFQTGVSNNFLQLQVFLQKNQSTKGTTHFSRVLAFPYCVTKLGLYDQKDSSVFCLYVRVCECA